MMDRTQLLSFGQRLKAYALSVDDGMMMRHFFHGLLVTSLVFIVIDWRELGTANPQLPGFDPMQPQAVPVLPPALTEGEPQNAPSDVTADPETLKQAIRFELKPGGILLAEGAIDPGAAARFASEIEARGEYVKTVQLNSPGGAVGDALAMSTLIREKKLDTRVASGALCASSCPIVMAGGIGRTAETDAVIGVHQVFNGSKEKLSPERAMSEAQRTTADVTRHLAEMGIKPGVWLHALETPPDRLYYLTGEEMKEFALTTEGATPVAEAKKE
ncbi:ATP-dependent Clp protease proteolytic subunit [Pararhizobium gei]|uniref:ATP-dependent Clp protease proteolytic subunit n=1 Tax=Pararhizobium gei TaxID=1395951 RepID=UPI0023DA2274|nr:ATP-dependent Clp protease proteolytic subunit [Rhizobium gei]